MEEMGRMKEREKVESPSSKEGTEVVEHDAK